VSLLFMSSGRTSQFISSLIIIIKYSSGRRELYDY
jgi:hypothetical protein